MASPLLIYSNPSPISLRRLNVLKTPSPTRFTVLCSGDNRKVMMPQFDRRDMLLGMGGLYGAANLPNGSAIAEPIPPVELDKCTRATDLSDQTPIEYNCCPSAGPTVARDYVLPTVSKIRVRPPLHLASDKYLAKFEKAVQAMKDLSAQNPNDPRGFTQQAHVHCAYCNLAYPQSPGSEEKLQIHFNWHFFPWHRWYLYFYERICAKLINDPTFALPFWNWDNPPAMFMPEIFTADSDSPLFNPKRDRCHYTATADLQYSKNDINYNPQHVIIKNNLHEMRNEMLRNGNSKELTMFYGGEYCVGSPNNVLMGAVEKGSHTALHIWVGENTKKGNDMGNFATAGQDMLFYCHHVNIDRLWSVWRDIRDRHRRPKDFTKRDWLDAKYVFYDENAEPVIVSVRDCLNNEKMGFTWQHVDNPWQRHRARPLVKKLMVAPESKALKTSDVTFPVKLDKAVRVSVDRPKKSRSAEEKEQEDELLEIEGIDVERGEFVRFEVFVNDEDAEPQELHGTAHYAGCYSQVPLTRPGRIKTKMHLNITELLEELDVEDDDKITVSVVPRDGGEFITIDGIKIVHSSGDA